MTDTTTSARTLRDLAGDTMARAMSLVNAARIDRVEDEQAAQSHAIDELVERMDDLEARYEADQDRSGYR